MHESLVLLCLSRDLFCKFLQPLTVLIQNCDIIHPLVRHHGPSRRSPFYLVSTIICFSNNNDIGDSRLYDIPDSTFESEEDTDESEEGRLITS